MFSLFLSHSVGRDPPPKELQSFHRRRIQNKEEKIESENCWVGKCRSKNFFLPLYGFMINNHLTYGRHQCQLF